MVIALINVSLTSVIPQRKEPVTGYDRLFSFLHSFLFSFTFSVFSGILVPVAQVHIEADEIKTAKPDKTIDDSGKPRHISKNKGYQVKAEDTNQQPVESTNDNQGKRSAVQVFISHSYLTFCTVSGTGYISFCNLPLFIHFTFFDVLTEK